MAARLTSRVPSRLRCLAFTLARWSGGLVAGFGTVTALHAALPAPPVAFVQVAHNATLAQADVRAFAQDRQGFIWIGLRLGGLARYDGYEIKHHEHDPDNPHSLGNRVIWSLLVDRTGTLWVGTEGGLDRYDQATDRFVHHRHDPERPESLPHNVIVSLFEDAQGHIWVGSRGGLSRLEDRKAGTFTTYRRPVVLPGSTATQSVRSITEDPRTGLLWLGTSDGLAAFDPRTGAFATYLHDPEDARSLSRNSINKVIREAGGDFWALTEHGLNRFTPQLERVPEHTTQPPAMEFERYVLPGDASHPGINFLRDGLIDGRDRLWLGSRAGLHVFDRTTRTFTTHRRQPRDPHGLRDDFIQAVFQDHAGNLWIGTYNGGVNLLRTAAKPFQVFRHDPLDTRSLSDDRVTGVAFGPDDRLWVTTGRGLNRRDDDGWTQFLHDPQDPDSLPSNALAAIAVGPDQQVWLGSNYHGLFRYDQTRFHSFPLHESTGPAEAGWQPSTGSQVNSLLPDDRGGVWLGARAYGIDYYFGGRFLHFPPREESAGQDGHPTYNAIFGLQARDGTIWYATEGGQLVRLDPAQQEFTEFTVPTPPTSTAGSVHDLEEGADGLLWLGTADGLVGFDPNHGRFLTRYTTAHGLPHSAVMSLARDDRGRLWLGTADGLSEFDPVTERFRNYDKPDGLPSNVFSHRAGARSADGQLFFGTASGLVAFDPAALSDNPTPPPVVITELRWIGPSAARQGSHRRAILNVGSTVQVPAGQLGLTFKFSALDFTAPEKNRFRYQLQGWDPEWVQADAGERTVTYTSLPPGSYTFRVQASNPDNVWNEEGASVRLIVAPLLWQTAWFRAGALSLLALGVATALNWRLRGVRRQNASLEAQVSERTTALQREIATRHLAEAALRESHDELESRVQARTAELAETNANLEAEITERKHVESQLRQSQKMEAIGQLAGGVAHDFNNLLTVILGQIDLMESIEMSEEERASAVRDITAAAQRASNLTRQLLVFSRHQAMNPVPVDLNHVVRDVGKLLGHVIGERIRLQHHLSPEPLGVRGDPGMLEQVLLNLALNARDAMPRGGELTLSARARTLGPEEVRGLHDAQPGAFAHLSVRDTGTGIPDEVLPKIFEPFFTTKESGKGTGLGLAISLGIVQKHGGWIDVETCPNAGTTFHVYLPLSPWAEVSPPAPVAPAQAPQQETTILLVEDELAVRRVVRTILARQGYRVLEASCGAEALVLWDQHRREIALLLTDIVMPGAPDGHELATQLAEDDPAIRIITMSGYDPNQFAGSDTPRPPLLRKPFTAEELLRTVAQALKTEAAPPA